MISNPGGFNNADAMFKKETPKPKPSGLLLHYNYGAAVAKLWGHRSEIIQNCPNIPHPSRPIPATGGPSGGPSGAVHDKTLVIQKLDGGRAARGHGTGNPVARGGTGEMVDSEGQGKWDEDELILFLWSNSKEAREYRQKEAEERTQHIEQWREGIL